MTRLRIASLISFALIAMPSYGAIVGIGSSNVPPDTFPASNFTGLSFLADTGQQNYSFDGGNVTGHFEEVVLADPLNTFCAGCLDFALLVAVDDTSTTFLSQIRFGIFGGAATDVGYSPGLGGSGNAPSTVFRGGGNNVGFNFVGSNFVLVPGDNTQILIVETNVTAFSRTGSFILNDGNGQQGIFNGAFVPAPEPSTAAMVGLGAIALLAFGKRLSGCLGLGPTKG